MTRIALCVPTRERPQRLAAMIRSAQSTARGPADLEWLFYLDDDDRLSEPAIDAALGQGQAQIVRGPRLRDQSYWNRLAEAAASDLVFLGADDLEFRTPGWDELICATCSGHARGGVGMVWADDGDLGQRLATHPFVSRAWIEAVGFFVPPYFERCFVDLWIFELAVLTGLGAYVPDALIEHRHVELGKAEPDALYEEIRERPFSHRRYTEYGPERLRQAQALLDAAGIDGAPDTTALAAYRRDASEGRAGKTFVWP